MVRAVTLFVLTVMLLAKLGDDQPRYAFHQGKVGFEITRFETLEGCRTAAKDMIEPMQKAGFMVHTSCEPREVQNINDKIGNIFK